MVRVSRDPWIDSTHTGIGSLVLNLEINILVVSYPHSSLQYCTVYTYSCTLTFTAAYSTVQCTRIHVSYPHFSLQYCTVCMYSCILLSLQPIILYRTKKFMYPTLTLAYNIIQNKNIHVSYSHSNLQYCTVYMYSCIQLSLQPIVLYSVHVFMYPTLTVTPTYSTVQCSSIHVSYSHSSLQNCTVYMYSCILPSLHPLLLYSVHVFMYLPSFQTIVLCTCIHVSYLHSSQ